MSTTAIRIYRSCLVDKYNVPDSIDVLNGVGYAQFTVSLNRNATSCTFKLAVPFSTAITYKFFTNIYEWFNVVSVRELNEQTCEIVGELNPLATLLLTRRGEDIRLTGWAERLSVADDTLYSNTIPEPFQPSLPLHNELAKFTADISAGYNTFYQSSVSLQNYIVGANPEGVSYTVGGVDAEVIVPKSPPLIGSPEAPETKFRIGDKGVNAEIPMPAVGLYRQSEPVAQALQIINSMGLDLIGDAYMLPVAYGGYEMSGATGTPIDVVSGVFQTSDIIFESNPFPTVSYMNNKVFTLFNTVSVTSFSSGDSCEYDMHDVVSRDAITGKYGVRFTIISDPSPKGRPYCRPEVVFGTKATGGELAKFDPEDLTYCVKGSPWERSPIVYRGERGYFWNAKAAEMSYNNAMVSKSYQAATAIIGSATQGYKTARNPEPTNTQRADAAQGLVGGAVTAYTAINELAIEEMRRDRVINYSQPVVRAGTDDVLQKFSGNGFLFSRCHLQAADMQRLDIFLNMYGYAVSEPITFYHLFTRQNFNYVKMSSVDLSHGLPSYEYNDFICELAKRQLLDGVRIWHVKPSTELLTQPNPIK